MSNITINAANHTIEMNKTFSKAASKYGTPEYIELQNARRDYPDFRTVTVAKKGAKPEYKGLTYEYMEKYIKAHDDEDGTIMAEYLTLRGKDEEGLSVDADSADYLDIKEWFFQSFPAIEQFYNKRNALIEKIAQRKAEKQVAKKAA